MATGITAVQTIDVVTPAAGESVTEGTILEWRVKVGDTIKVDDTIVEISTDKVDVELPSPGSGTVSEILVEEGETVTVGQVIARISVSGGAPIALPEAETSVEELDDEEQLAQAPTPDAAAAQAPGPDGTAVQTIDVVTPAAGESVTEGTILEWRVKVGDTIKVDDTIVEISTDKVDVELPSPGSGTVSEILVEEGETVTVGQVIARISVSGGAPIALPEAETSVEELDDEEQLAQAPTPDAAAAQAPAPDGTAAQTVDVLTPAAGESVTEGTILEWRVKVGDTIKVDDTIVEISTDKVDLELPAPATGTVSEILVEEGETVTVGQVIARISLGGGAP